MGSSAFRCSRLRRSAAVESRPDQVWRAERAHRLRGSVVAIKAVMRRISRFSVSSRDWVANSSMGTYGEKFYLHEANWLQRLWRDLRLLAYIAQIIWLWSVLGRRLRRLNHTHTARGTTFPIDFLGDEEL